MRTTSSKLPRKPPRGPRHPHTWKGYIVFKCRCGKTHRDRVYVARHGYLFITDVDTDSC